MRIPEYKRILLLIVAPETINPILKSIKITGIKAVPKIGAAKNPQTIILTLTETHIAVMIFPKWVFVLFFSFLAEYNAEAIAPNGIRKYG